MLGSGLVNPGITATATSYGGTGPTVTAGVLQPQHWQLELRQRADGTLVRSWSGSTSTTLAQGVELKDGRGVVLAPGGYTLVLSSAAGADPALSWTSPFDIVSPLPPPGATGSGAPGLPGDFVAVTPTRLLDTRSGVGQGLRKVPVGPKGRVDLQVTGVGGVPTGGVTAVAINVTGVHASQPTFLTVFPADSAQAGTSTVNLVTGEIRGRLDGVTPRSLLELVCALRPNARVSVRDASCLYEVEIRDGAPKRVSKTSGEGNFTRGEPALASLLGVGAGRFVVAPASSGAIEGELTGNLATLLARPIAAARGAVSLVPTMLVGRRTRVELDPEMLPGYLSSTPEPARSIVRLIAEGHFVADVLTSGNAMPSLIEDVVSDLASRGAILSVNTEEGEDLLPAAIEDALNILRGAPARVHAPLSALRPSQMPPPRIVRKPTPSEDSLDELLDEATEKKPEPKADRAPSSLADAVMKEISDRSPMPRRHVSSTPPPLIEPSALKPRSNPPEPERTENETLVEVHPMTPSIPMSVDDGMKEPDDDKEQDDEPAAAKEPQKLARTPMAAEAAKREPPKSDGWKWALGLVAAVLLLGVGVKSSLTPEPAPALAAAPMTTTTDVIYTELPQGATVGKNEGWIDVTAPSGVAVLVDGTERGRGTMHALLASGSHEVKCGDRRRTVMVRDAKVARVDLTTP